MEDLIQTFDQLSEPHRRQLLAYADILLIHQKVRKSDGNLTAWKEKIKGVSTWNEQDVKAMEASSKTINNWKVSEW